MRAMREFQYQRDADRKIVTVPAGAELNDSVLAEMQKNRIDIEKMVRTRYMEREEVAVTSPAPKRRGRPPKNK